MQDLIVVGGLAALAAAVYTLDKQLDVHVIAEDVNLPLLARLRERSNVTLLADVRVIELLGSVQIERFSIVRETEQAFVPANPVFADLGLFPHSDMVWQFASLDAEEFIVVDTHQATSIPGLRAAGDVPAGFCEQIVVALGDGTCAAVSAYDYLLAQPANHAQSSSGGNAT